MAFGSGASRNVREGKKSSALSPKGFGAGSAESRSLPGFASAQKNGKSSPSSKPAGSAPSQEAEIVWRGVLKQVRYHAPAGVVKASNGKVGNGWGVFQVAPLDKSKLPEGFAAHPKVYSQKSWTVSGVFVGEPLVGMDVLCHGVFHHDPKYGEQFKASVLAEPLPDVQDVEHVVQWLSKKTGASRHRIVGMTPLRARKAAEHFGKDILSALGDPARLREIFPESVCQEMADSFLRESGNYRLQHFFLENGLFQNQVHAVVAHLEEVRHKSGQAWTADSVVARTRENPYWLTDVSGIGFLMADRVAQSLGFASDHPLRIEAGIRYALEIREEQGHTATRREELLALAGGKDVLCVDANASGLKAKIALEDALNRMQEDPQKHRMVFWGLRSSQGKDSGEKWVARAVCTYSERYVARRIRDMSRRKGPVRLLSSLKEQMLRADPAAGAVILSASQSAAVLLACSSQIGVLTGGPGTGKTTCLQTVAHAAKAAGLRVELCAPSGKAASRLKQATGFDGKTIHRLLRLDPEGNAEYNAENPYPADLFIVDESSMVDVYLMQHLLRALPESASLLLVGDDQQLPSVGPGRIFGDIVDSGVVPVGRLTENRRQGGASDIAIGASRVISGRLPSSIPKGEPVVEPLPEAADFFSTQWVQTSQSEAALPVPVLLESIRQDIRDWMDRGVPVEHIQVLTPQKSGSMGVEALNGEMTALLNPAQKQPERLPKVCREPLRLGAINGEPLWWRVGDRVIQVKNDYEHEVFNGDMGVVLWTDAGEPGERKPSIGVYFEQGDLPVWKDTLEYVQSFRPSIPWTQWSLADLREVGVQMSAGDRGKIVWYESEQVLRVRHAGVLTIHKTQGSEYPYVLMLLHTSHHFMASRPLLYTGMTRAKKGLRLYAAESSARKAVRNQGQTRDTMLHRILTGSQIV